MDCGDVAGLAGQRLEMPALVRKEGVTFLRIVTVSTSPHCVMACQVDGLRGDVTPDEIVVGPFEIDGDIFADGLVAKILLRVVVNHPAGVVGGEVAVDADHASGGVGIHG